MPGLGEPLPPAVEALLRRAVLDLKATQRRKVFGPVVHVGEPGVLDVSFGVRAEEPMDHALRADVVTALLRRTARHEPALVWLTRPGELSFHDVDADWLAAARTAYAEAGRPLTMVVVTRRGWRDPRSGVRREWRRLRER